MRVFTTKHAPTPHAFVVSEIQSFIGPRKTVQGDAVVLSTTVYLKGRIEPAIITYNELRTDDTPEHIAAVVEQASIDFDNLVAMMRVPGQL